MKPLDPWAPTATPWLLAFDVREPRTRRRLEKVFEEFGFTPIQYSLRVATLTPGEIRRIRQRLARISDPDLNILLLPLGLQPPKALLFGAPLGMNQRRWDDPVAGGSGYHIGGPRA